MVPAARRAPTPNSGAYPMNYCSVCGAAVALRIPENDNRPRFVCERCQVIHYQNPKIVVGCVPLYEGRVLLCRRAIEPRKGYWTLPAGFLENGEACSDGARRETLEEACADVADLQLYTLFDLPHISQVYMFYRARVVEGKFGVGVESLDAELFEFAQIPWDTLAFPVVTDTLTYLIQDCQRGHFPVRHEVIQRRLHPPGSG